MSLTANCMRFRTLLRTKTPVSLFGAVDGITARTLVQQNFEALYVSGGALSASYGVPDIGLLSLDHFACKIKELSLSSGLPILADADSGFGDTEMVRKTVYEYFMAGACGMHIEDQVFPKRCGHLDGKKLVPASEMEQKIEAAVAASQDFSGGSFLICARTDARGVDGIDECIERSLRYLDAGAEMVFPEGLVSESEFELLATEVRNKHKDALLLANMTEFGKTDYIPLNRFASLGYNCVIYPVSTLRVQMKATEEFLVKFRKDGSVQPQLHKMRDRDELYKALQYSPGSGYKFPSPAAHKES